MSLGGTRLRLERSFNWARLLFRWYLPRSTRRPLMRYFRCTRSLRNCLLTYNNIPLSASDNCGMRRSSDRDWVTFSRRLSLIVEKYESAATGSEAQRLKCFGSFSCVHFVPEIWASTHTRHSNSRSPNLRICFLKTSRWRRRSRRRQTRLP